jgi:hypothetical protein
MSDLFANTNRLAPESLWGYGCDVSRTLELDGDPTRQTNLFLQETM